MANTIRFAGRLEVSEGRWNTGTRPVRAQDERDAAAWRIFIGDSGCPWLTWP